MTDKQIIIEDCPYFIGGNCQEYLDGVCENHKCDLKIIRELEEKLSNKRKECDELHETVKSQKEEIKNLNYTLYEERNLTIDLAKANLKISALKRDLNSARNRFKNENQQNKEIIKAKEQECEELKAKLIKWLGKEGLRQSEKEFYEQQLDQLKAENEELKGIRDSNFLHALEEQKRADKLSKTLTEIKPILEYYANSTLGEEQEDGTYRIELSYKYGSGNMYGAPCYYKYNPKPARQALQKISKCEGSDD